MNPKDSQLVQNWVMILFLAIAYPLGVLIMWFGVKWRTWIKVLISIPLIILITLAITWAFFIRPFEMFGNSMSPALKEGQYILTNIHNKKFERGDIVVFRRPNYDSRFYVGRIIALPNDRVMIENGNIYLNDILLDEGYALGPTSPGTIFDEGVPQTIPSESVFILGDNRNLSSDDREMGFTSIDEIFGKEIFAL